MEDHTLFGELLVGILRATPGIGGVKLATTAAAAIASKLGVVGAELVRLATVYNHTR